MGFSVQPYRNRNRNKSSTIKAGVERVAAVDSRNLKTIILIDIKGKKKFGNIYLTVRQNPLSLSDALLIFACLNKTNGRSFSRTKTFLPLR